MARGIEGARIFRSDTDREEFLRRLGEQAAVAGAQVLAWALLPNHLHVLLRTGRRSLASLLRHVLAGYAGAFNRPHRRRGHLFQNRYKSILVEEETYLLELTRYIHLNLLRAGVMRGLEGLERYPWGGHGAVSGRVRRPWQAVDDVLGQFATTRAKARRRYRAFVADGARQGRRPELAGGGLRRSAGTWEAFATLRRGRERWAFDEGVLGSGPFVERMLRGAAPPPQGRYSNAAGRALPILVEWMAGACGVSGAEVLNGSRRRPAAHARAAVAAVAVKDLAGC